VAQSQKRLIHPDSLPGERHGKHRLDQMPARLAKNIVMFQPSEEVVADLMAKARLSIPGLADTAEVIKALRHNPEYMIALARKSKFNRDRPDGEGFIALLPLNELGVQHLALNTFNAASPDTRLLAKANERPAGVYLWCVFAPGPLVAGMALFMEKMATPQYDGVDIYSRPNTEVGIRFNHGMGFVKGAKIGNIEAPNVWTFSRRKEPPLYDSYIPGSGKQQVGVCVAHSFQDFAKVMAIRNSVYVGEQECPFDEEYDGNDFSATHLLAYIGDEPVGCLRLRFFADFAKFERMAIRKEYRKSRAAIHLARAGFKFCQKKGYRQVYGHIQERLVPFWSRFGFRVKENTRRFVFSDFEYVEIVADIERDPDAITIGIDPYVIIRPEGRWHVSGILERSSMRPASGPSVAKKH